MTTPTSGTSVDTGDEIGAIDTIRRGMAHSPELTEGIRFTLFLAVVASVGQIVVPVAVQQTLDKGLHGEAGPDVAFTVAMGVVAEPFLRLANDAARGCCPWRAPVRIDPYLSTEPYLSQRLVSSAAKSEKIVEP